ncbi:MAG: hypothetical protein MUE90_05160 [Thermoanaerobaculales bacterium]|jgi:hypothetical protein|nr:hypothetical protein [Thermoanaerobaculales bacterium]
MRHLILASILVAGCAAPGVAADTRTLSGAVPAEGVEAIALDSSIGDVEIRAVEGAREITVEVLLTPRRGGFFSSKKRAEQDVEAASLSIKLSGGTLALHVAPKGGDDRRFEEDWRIELPPTVALELDHGVGDIDIRGPASRIEVDAGVGDVRIEAGAGDIAVDIGVGDVLVRAPAAAYASAEASCGVGDVRMTAAGERVESGGFVGTSASWKGLGGGRIEVSAGVGDAVITLD